MKWTSMSDCPERGPWARSCGAWVVALLLAFGCAAARADIYGYVDEKGVAHFAAEKLDERYQIFFKGGQSFDTADGLGRSGRP